MPFSSSPARRALGLCLVLCAFAAGVAGLASAAPSSTVAPSDDAYATAKHADDSMGSFVVFLSDDAKLADKLQALAKKEGIKHTVLAIDAPAGPDG